MELSITELRKAIDYGTMHFEQFMHPAHDGFRDDPRFVAVMEYWMERINRAPEQLGLPPAKLNYEAGPGMLPFVLDPETSVQN